MAFRRTYRKRRSSKRRFTRRFKRLGRRSSRRTGKPKFLVKRTVVQTVDIATTADVITTFQVPASTDQEYVINKLPSYTEFTNLFDSYKLCAIKQKFIFDRNSADPVTVPAAGSVIVGLPTLLTVNDYNDSTAIASEDEILQQPSYKQRRLDKPVTRYFKPKCLATMAGGNSMETRGGYLSCSSSSDQVFYGLKWAVRSDHSNIVGPVSIGTMRIYITYYMSFKNMK